MTFPTRIDLIQAIQLRTTELCRQMVRDGQDPDEIPHHALRQAVDEHIEDLAEHPDLAEIYAADLRRAESACANTPTGHVPP